MSQGLQSDLEEASDMLFSDLPAVISNVALAQVDLDILSRAIAPSNSDRDLNLDSLASASAGARGIMTITGVVYSRRWTFAVPGPRRWALQ